MSSSHEAKDASIVVTARRADPFARVPKTITAPASGLSLEAIGLMSILLGKPPGWNVKLSQMARERKISMYAVRKVFNEIRAAGYARLIQARDGGHISGWEWQIADAPIYRAMPESTQE